MLCSIWKSIEKFDFVKKNLYKISNLFFIVFIVRLLQNLSQRLISIPENEILHQAAQAAAAAAAVAAAAAAAALVSSTLTNASTDTSSTSSTNTCDSNQEMDIDILQVITLHLFSSIIIIITLLCHFSGSGKCNS